MRVMGDDSGAVGGFFELYLGDVLSGDLDHFLVICDVAGVVPIGRLVAQGDGGDHGQRPGDGGGFGGLGWRERGRG